MSAHDELLARAGARLAKECGPSGMHYGDEMIRELYVALLEVTTELRDLDELPLSKMTTKHMRRRVKELRREKKRADENTAVVAAQRDAYDRVLWDIYTATGADTDGDTDGQACIAGMGRERYARMVLDAVKELARDYDAALEER